MAGPEKTLTEPVRIRDDTLRGFLGYHMKRAFHVLQGDLQRVLRPFGLRMVTYSALATITDNPGLRQGQLADALAIERPNLVVILDELEQAGLITRDKVPTDRRAYALNPTLKGRRLGDKATSAIQANEARFLSGVTEADRVAVIGVMNRIERG